MLNHSRRIVKEMGYVLRERTGQCLWWWSSTLVPSTNILLLCKKPNSVMTERKKRKSLRPFILLTEANRRKRIETDLHAEYWYAENWELYVMIRQRFNYTKNNYCAECGSTRGTGWIREADFIIIITDTHPRLLQQVCTIQTKNSILQLYYYTVHTTSV